MPAEQTRPTPRREPETRAAPRGFFSGLVPDLETPIIAYFKIMSSYTAEIHWTRGAQVFTDNRYSRKHLWRFDGGIEIPASSSAHVVPLPYSVNEAVDPEAAFVVSLSSCHMLWFLSIAAKQGFVVDDYHDAASGVMEKNSSGKLAMTNVVLRPKVKFSGPHLPDHAMINALHHRAHEECFIANSVLTDVSCEPRYETEA